MSDRETAEITRILREMRDGDPRSVDVLLPLVYDELHRIAARAMGRERQGHTLQPTALVHEAYVRLVRAPDVAWQDRAHFLGIAGRVMRQVLVDHARRRSAARRGGGVARVTLSDEGDADAGFALLEVHEALERLAALDARTAKVAELRLFAGATVDEVAEALGVSPRTVDGEWKVARMWLARELGG